MANLLLDTGAFVALLDRSEANHGQCAAFLRSFSGEIFTTEPVLTETIYLLGHSAKGKLACIDFILKGGAILVPQSPASLKRAAELMAKYSDIPMDFADASLVALAEEMSIDEIFTLDIRGFRSYRMHGRKFFTIHP